MHINILTKSKKKCSKFHNDLIKCFSRYNGDWGNTEGNLEILFLPKFQKNISYKSVMIIVSYQ